MKLIKFQHDNPDYYDMRGWTILSDREWELYKKEIEADDLENQYIALDITTDDIEALEALFTKEERGEVPLPKIDTYDYAADDFNFEVANGR